MNQNPQGILPAYFMLCAAGLIVLWAFSPLLCAVLITLLVISFGWIFLKRLAKQQAEEAKRQSLAREKSKFIEEFKANPTALLPDAKKINQLLGYIKKMPSQEAEELHTYLRTGMTAFVQKNGKGNLDPNFLTIIQAFFKAETNWDDHESRAAAENEFSKYNGSKETRDSRRGLY